MTPEININSSGFAEVSRGNKTPVALKWPHERQKPYQQTCSRHETHETVDTDEFSVVYNGVEYVPREDAGMSYCPDCLGDHRNRHVELSDAPDDEVIGEIITNGSNWRDFKDGLEIAYLQQGNELTHCPFCGEELTATNQDTGRVTCPNHGPMGLDVKQFNAGSAAVKGGDD